MPNRIIHIFEIGALMAVLGFAFVIYGRFCSDLPNSVAIMYLMLFSLVGWSIDFLRVKIPQGADIATAYPVALRRNIRTLWHEIDRILGNNRGLLLLCVAGVTWYFYWFVLFSIAKTSSIFAAIILLQIPLVLGPVAIITAFRHERAKLKNITAFLLGVLLVFLGVTIHKFSKGKYGFEWTSFVSGILLLALAVLGKLLRLHLIRYNDGFGKWSRLSTPISVHAFFLFYFTLAFLIALAVAMARQEAIGISIVQLCAMAFLGIVPTALCGMWEQSLGERLGSFALLEGAHGLKAGLSVPLDFLLYWQCVTWPALGCSSALAALPDAPFFVGVCCTVGGIVLAFRQVKE